MVVREDAQPMRELGPALELHVMLLHPVHEPLLVVLPGLPRRRGGADQGRSQHEGGRREQAHGTREGAGPDNNSGGQAAPP